MVVFIRGYPRMKAGGGGKGALGFLLLLLFRWVCAARDSKFGPSLKNKLFALKLIPS